ncbi:LamG-like jellyroll fold domain-containing protein [Haloprofundus halobius]|uniref:LamG-like jellyroll fold domain-containing protein n=1 Tax=Haloprofundus halobius TaxID=2876194 RepID=UPI001CCB8E7B|nr:LamG-like jellyroll fold domain-containing protein [Haloprofundus halobius]
MTETREATNALLAERPNAESALRSVLAADEHGTWTFDDVDVDSGLFGEIVAAGIVEKRDGGYRVSDPAGVRAALDGDGAAESGRRTASGTASSVTMPSLSNVNVDRTAALALVGALVFLALVRLISVSAVFREGTIVLSANDPYFYRYIVETVAAETSGPFDFESLASLPHRVTAGEPLLIVTLWFWTELLGGDANASGLVLALYPVVFAVLTGALVYLSTVRLTDDQRVGLAAVVALALVPAHAYRTSLGFADHHAFDYFWLALTAAALVSLAVRSGRGRDAETGRGRETVTALWSVVFGVAVAGQTLAWEAGPLLILPLGLIIVGWATTAVRAGKSPIRELGGVVGGLALAALLTAGAHVALGWHGATVAFAPAGLVVGAAAVVGVAELASRQEWSSRTLAGGEVVAGVVAFGILPLVVPQLGAELQSGIQFLLETEGIAETQSLVGAEQGSLVGPVLSFGFLILLALPYAGWAVLRSVREYEPAWLAMATYTWYFLALALVQLRFAGELSVFVAVFAGLGFVHLAAKIDAVRTPKPFAEVESGRRGRERANETVGLERPERREAMSLVGLGLLAGSLSFVQVPVKTGQLLVSDGMYDAAMWMREYSEEQGWEYPENYVFSEWSWNRAYNYLVNGESDSYGFAYSNYRDFLGSSNGEKWYRRLQDQVGFIVTQGGVSVARSGDGGGGGATLQSRLHTQYGGGDNSLPGLGHYRALFASDDGSQKVFGLVPGAVLVGQGDSGSQTVQTEVDVGGESVTYERSVQPTENGWYAVRVPHTGEYSLAGERYQVSEEAVESGGFTSEKGSRAVWSFDEGRGEFVFDSEGGHHGSVSGVSWTEGIDGYALEFDGSGSVSVPNAEALSGEDGFTVSAWVRTDEDVDYRGGLEFPRLVANAENGGYGGTEGYQLALGRGNVVAALGDGSDVATLRGPRIDDAEWHHLAVVWDGEEARLYVDGDTAGSREFDGSVTPPNRLGIGSSSDDSRQFRGRIDQVEIRDQPIDSETVIEMYDRFAG